MKKLIFATHNLHKVKEIQNLVKDKYQILSLDDIGYTMEIPEDQVTIEDNALIKARHIYDLKRVNCFADDTGLEVKVLSGQPGVFSARFAELTGELKPEENVSDANIRKLLQILEGTENRKARFKTIIALIMDGKQYIFEGIVNGQILTCKRGTSGFGYDPVFLPSGYHQTFAEMSLDQKNRISHRAKAVHKLIEFLEKQL